MKIECVDAYVQGKKLIIIIRDIFSKPQRICFIQFTTDCQPDHKARCLLAFVGCIYEISTSCMD